jgi:hypothetical protein
LLFLELLHFHTAANNTTTSHNLAIKNHKMIRIVDKSRILPSDTIRPIHGPDIRVLWKNQVFHFRLSQFGL